MEDLTPRGVDQWAKEKPYELSVDRVGQEVEAAPQALPEWRQGRVGRVVACRRHRRKESSDQWHTQSFGDVIAEEAPEDTGDDDIGVLACNPTIAREVARDRCHRAVKPPRPAQNAFSVIYPIPCRLGPRNLERIG